MSYEYEIPSYEVDNCSRIERTFYASDAASDELFMTPTYIGHYNCRPGYAIDRAGMVGSCLLLVTLSGSGCLRYRGETYEPVAGTVMLLDCEQRHEYFVTGDEWQFKYFHYEGAMSVQYTNYLIDRFSALIRPDQTDFDEILKGVDRITALAYSQHTGSDAVMSGEIYSILMRLISSPKEKSERRESKSELVQAAIEYIKEHCGEPIDVSDIASALYLSRSYFSVTFKRVLGVTPHRYMTEYRIKLAKQLLAQSSYSICEIALSVGFSDQSVFARTFLRVCGMTPLAYRRIWRR